ncbi:DUF4149 domain-containing protein [Rhodoferax sp.]|jgi:hypothetical protein|uniref:DUF4149 domain-containing protein n=1 Tax=Rhodoferax sp. TaxID=50421 RepID=UPI003783F37C
MRNLHLWIAAIWAVSLGTLGLFVVPMLFAHLPTPALAGNMAAKLFSVQTMVSVTCAVVLLLLLRSDKRDVGVTVAQSSTVYVLAGALLALLVELGVAPRIVARDNLALWHAVGSAMYLAQWLCACVVFGKLLGEHSTSG